MQFKMPPFLLRGPGGKSSITALSTAKSAHFNEDKNQQQQCSAEQNSDQYSNGLLLKRPAFTQLTEWSFLNIERV